MGKVSQENLHGYSALLKALKKRHLERAIKYLSIPFSVQVGQTGEPFTVSVARHANLNNLAKFVKKLYCLTSTECSQFYRNLRAAIKTTTTGIPPSLPLFKLMVNDDASMQLNKALLLAKVDELNGKKITELKEVVHICLEDSHGNKYKTYMRTSKPLHQLVQYSSVCFKVPSQDIRLMFGDDYCDVEDTPYDLGFIDGASIRVYNLNTELNEYMSHRRKEEPQIEVTFKDTKHVESHTLIIDSFMPLREAFETFTSLHRLDHFNYMSFMHNGTILKPNRSPSHFGIKPETVVEVQWHPDVRTVTIQDLTGNLHKFYDFFGQPLEGIIDQYAKSIDRMSSDVILTYDGVVIDEYDTCKRINYQEGAVLAQVE